MRLKKIRFFSYKNSFIIYYIEVNIDYTIEFVFVKQNMTDGILTGKNKNKNRLFNCLNNPAQANA